MGWSCTETGGGGSKRQVLVEVEVCGLRWRAQMQPIRKLSRVNFEGEQLLGVHVVERTQLGKLEKQLGEGGGRLLAVVLNYQVSQGPDQFVLQGLHWVQVLDPWAIWAWTRRGTVWMLEVRTGLYYCFWSSESELSGKTNVYFALKHLFVCIYGFK